MTEYRSQDHSPSSTDTCLTWSASFDRPASVSFLRSRLSTASSPAKPSARLPASILWKSAFLPRLGPRVGLLPGGSISGNRAMDRLVRRRRCHRRASTGAHHPSSQIGCPLESLPHSGPEELLDVPRGLVAIDEYRAEFDQDCRHVLELVLDRAVGSIDLRKQPAAKFRLAVGLSSKFQFEHGEVEVDDPIDFALLQSQPSVHCARITREARGRLAFRAQSGCSLAPVSRAGLPRRSFPRSSAGYPCDGLIGFGPRSSKRPSLSHRQSPTSCSRAASTTRSGWSRISARIADRLAARVRIGSDRDGA